MSQITKPKLDIDSQVNYLERKGVKFSINDKLFAINFLTNNSYFYKLKAYCKNYDKKISDDTYINLEFAYLKELSTLDLHFRRLCIRFTLDIEHTLKTKLIRDFNNNLNCDGYQIVIDFLNTETSLKNKLTTYNTTGYVAKDSILNKYGMDLAIWNFIEIIEFGNFIKFCDYYYNKYSDITYTHIKDMLWSVKCIRNSSAHNNCLLHNLKPNSYTNFKRNNYVTTFLYSNLGMSKEAIKKKMSIPAIHDFIILLLVYKKICKSKYMIHALYKDLHKLINIRFKLHKDYFEKNTILKSNFIFLRKVVIMLKKN